MKLKIVKSDNMDNWYLIERAEHDGRMWIENTMVGGFPCMALQSAARFSDADVEGSEGEMRSLASVIRSRRDESFKRCAVRIDGDKAFFCSPRNSQRDGEVTLAEADDLAEQIEKMLGTS